MRSLIRPPLVAVAALLLALGGASLYLASAKADDATTAADERHRRQRHPRQEAQANQAAGPRSLQTGAEDGRQPDRVAVRLRRPRPDAGLQGGPQRRRWRSS